MLNGVDVYKKVLKGELKRFPIGYWKNEYSKENAISITKYLLEDLVKLDYKSIPTTVNNLFFAKHKLTTMLTQTFNNSTVTLIQSTYPNVYKPWELYKARYNSWTYDETKEAIKWMIEDKLKWSLNDIKEDLQVSTFNHYGLGYVLDKFYNNNIFSAINTVYPNQLKPWELKRLPKGFWTRETAISATRWLIETKLNLSEEEVKYYISKKLFIDNGLCGLITGYYKGSPYKAISDAYPNKYTIEDFKGKKLTTLEHNLNKKYSLRDLAMLGSIGIYELVLSGELKGFPQYFWSKKRAIKLIKYLIEDKLQLTHDKICTHLSYNFFEYYKLRTMVNKYFDGSTFKVVNTIYPNEFKAWEFSKTANGILNEETAKEAVKWLVENKLKLTDEQIKENMSRGLFNKHGLGGVLVKYFNASPFNAINTIYPNKFKPWELKNKPKNYWNIETSKKAIKWMIEEKLEWDREDIKENLTYNTFNKYGLRSMLATLYNNSPYKAIDATYPNEFIKEDLRTYRTMKEKNITFGR